MIFSPPNLKLEQKKTQLITTEKARSNSLLSTGPRLNTPLPQRTKETNVREGRRKGVNVLQAADSPKTFHILLHLTWPKMTCFPFNHGVGTVQMKNWEPLVFLPELAIDSTPGLSWISSGWKARTKGGKVKVREGEKHICEGHVSSCTALQTFALGKSILQTRPFL